MKILAIGAHPDDIEIFMYGLLCLFKQKNYNLNLLVVTDGSRGGTKFKNLKKIRADESLKALKKIGIPKFLNLPDGELGLNISHKTELKLTIDNISPDLIITHYKKDYHSDHRILSNYVKNIAGHNIPVLYCDTMMGINFKPNIYFDITDCFKEKSDAILCHESQNPKRFVKLAKLMNSYRSAQCNANFSSYAEAYYFKPSFPFTDISSILPKNVKIKKFDIDRKFGFL